MINGYKDLFLKTDTQGKFKEPEEYRENTTFEDIYYLHSFDRKLRNMILGYILIFESSIKAKVSYRFSEMYSEQHAYLVLKNYTRDPKQLKNTLNLLSTISYTISQKGKASGTNPIKHYIDAHEGVPLWVLVNYLTLGNINYFYQCLDESLQNKIAKDFAVNFNRDYKVNYQITATMIHEVLKMANFFRNVCAREERMYNFSVHKPPKNMQISNVLAIPNQYLESGKLYSLICFLRLVISKNDFNKLVRNIKTIFDRFEEKFTKETYNKILKSMGFPNDWSIYLENRIN